MICSRVACTTEHSTLTLSYVNIMCDVMTYCIVSPTCILCSQFIIMLIAIKHLRQLVNDTETFGGEIYKDVIGKRTR